MAICIICNKQYNRTETIRVYGTLPDLNDCCSAICYTHLKLGKLEKSNIVYGRRPKRTYGRLSYPHTDKT